MKRINILPNIITAFGLACGLFVIFRVNLKGVGTYELLYTMTFIILLAAVADLLDGAVARAIRAESEFGFLFDSLADAISFGVAPAVLMLKSLSLSGEGVFGFYAIAAAMIYTICGVLRLVRFNVGAAKLSNNMEAKKDMMKNFVGLPIPAGAIAAISPNLLMSSPLFEEYFSVSIVLKAIFVPTITIFLGYLMVSKLKFPSLKTIHTRIPSFQMVFLVTIVAICTLYGLLYYFAIFLAASSWGYICLGLTLSGVRMIRGRRAKGLEDYEIEDDHELEKMFHDDPENKQ